MRSHFTHLEIYQHLEERIRFWNRMVMEAESVESRMHAREILSIYVGLKENLYGN